MQDTNRRVLTESEYLVSHLWLESTLINTPLPFGSFEKAKYTLFMNGNNKEPFYFFTTTCRNTEDCLNIMMEKYKSEFKQTKYYKVYKTVNGVTQFLFTNKPPEIP